MWPRAAAERRSKAESAGRGESFSCSFSCCPLEVTEVIPASAAPVGGRPPGAPVCGGGAAGEPPPEDPPVSPEPEPESHQVGPPTAGSASHLMQKSSQRSGKHCCVCRPWVSSYFQRFPMHIYCLPVQAANHRARRGARTHRK